MTGRHGSARTRAWIGAACFTATIAASAPAHASSDGAYGFLFAFALFAGATAAATPYFAAADFKEMAPATFGFDFGAGRHFDAYTLGADVGGYHKKGGVLGWMGRARFEFSGEQTNAFPGYMALRIDSVALLKIAGDANGPVVLEGLPGLTVWPWTKKETTPESKGRAFCGIGPTFGLRLRAMSKSPHFVGELEVDYAPLFGAAPSGRVHHVEVGSALGLAPWSSGPGVVTFELRSRVEIGLGGADIWRDTGVSLLGGVRIRLDLLDKLK